MDQVEFERVAASFAAFHAEFAPLFGRTEARECSERAKHAHAARRRIKPVSISWQFHCL